MMELEGEMDEHSKWLRLRSSWKAEPESRTWEVIPGSRNEGSGKEEKPIQACVVNITALSNGVQFHGHL